MSEDPADETFPPTGGRVLGVVALAVGVLVAVLGLVDGDQVSLLAVGLGLLFAALAWTALLRPRVAIESDELVLRNMVDTVRVPLAAVEEVVVRQVLAVRVGDKRFTSPAVGRSRRSLGREGLQSGDVAAARAEDQSFGLFVQERIRERAKAERDRLGVRVASPEHDALTERVRRSPAVPEIAWLVVSVGLLAAAALV